MRIGMIVMNEFRPDVRVLKEAKTLINQGHQVHVVAIRHNMPVHEIVEGIQVRRLNIRSLRGQATTLAQFLRYGQFARQATRVFRTWQPDVCHVHDVTTLLPGYLTSRLCHCPLIYDAHEFEAGRQFGGNRIPLPMRWTWTLPEKLFIRKAAAVITVSEAIADALTVRYYISRPTVVRNVPEWEEVSKSDLLRSSLRLATDTPILLYQGWLVRGRGLPELIRSLSYLERGVLVIIGAGPLLDELHALAAELGLAERVHFTGRIEPGILPLYTSSANVGLHLLQNTCLNHNYALPNKLFEYMRAGLPVVVGDTLEMKRLVEAEDVGISVDPKSPEVIAKAIQAIWSDPASYARFSTNGLRAVRERHNWQIESQKLLNIYMHMVAG